MSTPSARDIVVRGVRLRLHEMGSGPPVVLVHGFLVSHLEWASVIPLLARSFHVIAPDMPGAGESDRPSPSSYPYTREAFAETLVAMLDALELPRAHVCGHSLGGGIALTLAADHPARVDRLVAVDSMSFPFDVPFKGRLPLLPGVGAIIFKKLYGRRLFHDYFTNDVWSGHPGMDAAMVDRYFDAFDTSRETAYATLRATVDTAALAAKIPRITAPTRVLWGAEDRIFPLALGHRLTREIPRATLHVFERCGHAPNEAQPAACADQIAAHLAGPA